MSSHTQATATTVRSAIVVEAPIERAFRVFTEDFDRVKPREHNMLSVEIAETVFEPRVGGRVYDRGVDGSECRWARVLAYEPPDRVAFSWDISPQWQIETDLEKTSEVEVRFIAEGPDRTRVELEHRNLDRHGAGWEAVREGVDSGDDWPVAICAGDVVDPTWRELDAGAQHEISDGPGDQRLAGRRFGGDGGGDLECDAVQAAVAELALAGVQPGAHGNAVRENVVDG